MYTIILIFEDPLAHRWEQNQYQNQVVSSVGNCTNYDLSFFHKVPCYIYTICYILVSYRKPKYRRKKKRLYVFTCLFYTKIFSPTKQYMSQITKKDKEVIVYSLYRKIRWSLQIYCFTGFGTHLELGEFLLAVLPRSRSYNIIMEKILIFKGWVEILRFFTPKHLQCKYQSESQSRNIIDLDYCATPSCLIPRSIFTQSKMATRPAKTIAWRQADTKNTRQWFFSLQKNNKKRRVWCLVVDE